MKERFAAFLVAKSKIILTVSILLALCCGALIPLVHVNQDMTDYLPENSSMRRGLDLMEAEFGTEEESTLRLMFSDLASNAEKAAVLRELEAMPHVDSVDWEAPGSKNGEDYNRGKYTLFEITCDKGQYTKEASALWEAVQERYGQEHEISLGGSIDAANHNGLPLWIALSAVGLVFLVLIIMSNAWIEPAAFMITIGIAVLINMGSYVLFPNISKTTFGIVAILQLALSMDYSIMLLNRYRQQRALTDDKHQAMREALSLSFGAITGSSLTTFAGLLALLFMSFGIGVDIGLALAKGVLVSLLCIFTALPALLLGFDGLMARTAKPSLPFDLPKLSLGEYRLRIPLTLLFAALFAAGFIIRGGVDFSYAQYGSGDAIDAVFGRDNTMVMLYNEKDSEEAGRLADQLDARSDTGSAVCYESSLGKSRTAADMKDFIEDMRDSGEAGDNDTDLSISMMKLIYYDYYAGGADLRLTIPGFVSYLQDEVFDDPDFGDSVDREMKDRIDDLEKYTDAAELTRPKNAAQLAAFFDMKKSQAKQLLLYYQIKGSGSAGKMSLPAFIRFLINDVASDSEYGSMIDDDALSQLNSMRPFTKKDRMTEPVLYEDAAQTLGMDASQMRLIYLYYFADAIAKAGGSAQGDAQDASPAQDSAAQDASAQDSANASPVRTIAQLAQTLQAMAQDPAFTEQFQGGENAKLTAGLSQIGQMDPQGYDVQGVVTALAGYGIPLDAGTVTLLFAYSQLSETPQDCAVSIQDIIHYMLDTEAISGSMPGQQKSQMQTLRKIIDTSVSGRKLSASDMGSLLGMKKKDVRNIYLLHTYKYGNTSGWKLSPQKFIHFLVKDVLNDKSMKDRIGDSAEDLKMAKKLIDGVVAGTEYTASGLADLFADYSDDMDADSLALLYELYGSQNRYDDSWTMDLMGMVTHLDEKMVNRPAFAKAMDQDQVQDVHDMRADMDEAAYLLKGSHYGRMMISSKLPEDSDETRAFMDQLSAAMDDRFENDAYLIGSTPMAYETSKTFHAELNRITLLTAAFIFIIVLLTFRRLTTSVILVLLIQCAVFMTMGVLKVLNVDMNYLALLIVQSIMMGATIDYAIVFTSYYTESRGSLLPAEAIRASYKGSLQTILTSAIILIAAVGALSFAFSEPATRQICRILSLGCLIATVLVLFILPGILACLDRFVAPKGAPR